ncbi:DUF881 domain-containing protein [Nocardioides sp.]|uniref:DUF881 domain-containing protein n=1 Tax=Nocardioides sp. TaxID=35761 RepID=UPI002612DB76|nr:DUF881 domain-containing protein [Nocardioides sp.]
MTQTPTRFTTPLLELITQQSLDADYELVAAQPQRDTESTPSRRRHLSALVILVLFGLLLAIAAVQTGRNASVVSAGREQLITRIDERRQVVSDQQSRIAELRASKSEEAAQDRTLATELTQAEAIRDSLAATAGWAPATGEGIRAVVTDNAATGDGGLVHDSDLALLADVFWHSGARAISVNGQRLTALSAFRNSADVIRLNGVSLSPPYVVVALGDATAMRSGLQQSTVGKSFSAVVRSVGLGFTVQNVNDLEVPAAASSRMTLRHAETGTASSRSSKKEVTK